MEALTAKAALVDLAALDVEAHALTTQVPRSEIESALKKAKKGPTDLFLDVARVRDGDREAEQRIHVSWEADDLERLLETTPAENVTLAFKPEELAQMLEAPDVEAQGLREKAAVLSVAAATAVGISAGVANAQVAMGDSGGGPTTAAAQVITDTTSSGPGAVGATAASSLAQQEHAFRVSEESTGAGGSQFVTDATSSGPGAPVEATSGSQFVTDTTSSGPGTTVEATGAGGESFLATSGGAAALAGGIALLITGAGFVAVRQRRGVQPA